MQHNKQQWQQKLLLVSAGKAQVSLITLIKDLEGKAANLNESIMNPSFPTVAYSNVFCKKKKKLYERTIHYIQHSANSRLTCVCKMFHAVSQYAPSLERVHSHRSATTLKPLTGSDVVADWFNRAEKQASF